MDQKESEAQRLFKEVMCDGCGVLFVPKRKRAKGERNFHNDDCRLSFHKRQRLAERKVIK